jgi:hypothetical protein
MCSHDWPPAWARQGRRIMQLCNLGQTSKGPGTTADESPSWAWRFWDPAQGRGLVREVSQRFGPLAWVVESPEEPTAACLTVRLGGGAPVNTGNYGVGSSSYVISAYVS